jgi:hypothetical protein
MIQKQSKTHIMKTIIVLLLILFATGCATAQAPAIKTNTNSINARSVPEAVKTTFKNEFPAIQPKWETDNKNYKAIFSDPKTNSKGIITYDPEGKVIHRDVETNTTPEKNEP